MGMLGGLRHEHCADIVEPFVKAMRKDVLEQRYLCTDATGQGRSPSDG